LYHLTLNLPIKVTKDSIKSYFDCKIKRLFIYAKKEDKLIGNITENVDEVFTKVKVQIN
jgi:hypothetical protein